MKNEPIPQVLATVDQGCLALSVGRTQLYRFIRDGIIRPVKIGRAGTRIPVSELEAVPDRLREREQAAA